MVKKNFVYLLLTCAITAGFSACKVPTSGSTVSSSPNITTLSPESAAPQGTVSQAQPKQGTGDSGGGNLYKGKPLESYVKDIAELDATKKFVAPAFRMLPQSAIGNTLQAILKVKTWYFVPGPLADLPREKIGSMVPTEQAALQDFNQVWIDKDHFEKMSESEKAELIFHEALMGMKLLKFDSPQSACLLIEKFKLKSILIGRYADIQKCQALSNTPLGTISELTVTDYSQIREMAALLNQRISEIEQSSNHSLEWWRDGDKAIDYQQQFSLTSWSHLFNAGNFSFQQTFIAREVPAVSVDDTVKLIAKNIEAGYKLSNGYDISTLDAQFPQWKREYGLPAIENKWVSHDTCSFELKQNAGQYEISFQVGGFQKKYSVNMEENSTSPLLFAESNYWFNSEILEKRSLIGEIPVKGSGAKVEKLFGYFDFQHRLRYVVATEVLNSNKFDGLSFYSQDTWQDSYLKGYYYLCALDRSIDLGRLKGK
jgi:hypothetical protein